MAAAHALTSVRNTDKDDSSHTVHLAPTLSSGVLHFNLHTLGKSKSASASRTEALGPFFEDMSPAVSFGPSIVIDQELATASTGEHAEAVAPHRSGPDGRRSSTKRSRTVEVRLLQGPAFGPGVYNLSSTSGSSQQVPISPSNRTPLPSHVTPAHVHILTAACIVCLSRQTPDAEAASSVVVAVVPAIATTLLATEVAASAAAAAAAVAACVTTAAITAALDATAADAAVPAATIVAVATATSTTAAVTLDATAAAERLAAATTPSPPPSPPPQSPPSPLPSLSLCGRHHLYCRHCGRRRRRHPHRRLHAALTAQGFP